MKKMSSCLLALVFALGSSIAIGAPGHGDRERKGAKQQHRDKHFNVGRHHNVPRMAHSSNHKSHYKNKHKAHHKDKLHRKQARHHRKHKIEKQHRRHHRKHDGWRDKRWDRNYKFHKRARHNYWKHNGWRYNHWNNRGSHYRNWHSNRLSHHYRHKDRYYGSYLGAAIVGSALTYSLYHRHDGAVCYDSHDDHDDRGYQGTEVVGCHRIERLEDGSQIRVEVPLSECR